MALINWKPKKPINDLEMLRVGDHTDFNILEAYKHTRTNLLFSLAAHESKIVVISSALPGEGKSTTCSNLAITMAQTGARVLLIDADMRKPMQHKIFRLANTKGLSNLLVGFHQLSEILYVEVEPELDIITSGTLPPNPSELVGSPAMKNLVGKMAERYDYVFIDSPPVNVVSDAIILSNIAAGILLVTRQGYCSYAEFSKAVTDVEFANANILGVVINGMREKNFSGRRGGKYGYASYSYTENAE